MNGAKRGKKVQKGARVSESIDYLGIYLHLYNMSLQSKENRLRDFKLGLFEKDAPAPIAFDQMRDDVGNRLEDDEGNVLVVPE